MGNKQGRPGAVRKNKNKPVKGTGGNGRQALEGKGPTPKAEDRTYHVAGKRKLAQERLAASRGRRPDGAKGQGTSQRPDGARGQGAGQGQGSGQRPAPARRIKQADDSEIVTGRNSVLEALRSRIPATTLYIATRIEMDDRVKEIMTFATRRGLPILEVTRPELDRLAGIDSVHQGVAIKVPPYEYAHPEDLIARAAKAKGLPLIVALDGITDPRNLGAIIRSSAAFGANGVLLPQRRSVGLTASAWKTSAGAAARVPVAMAANMTRALQSFKEQGYFVIGLDGGGDTPLPGLPLADRPLVVVVGNEGKGLSRLVTETCDAIVSIPISAATESLNAGIATSVALYEIAKLRSE